MLGDLLSSPAIYFTIPGALGLVFFILKTTITLLGFGVDDPGGVDVPAGADDVHQASGFGILSVQSGMAFLMGFGWGGLLGLLPLGWSVPASILIGLAAGLVVMFGQAALWRAMFKLQSSGNIAISQAIGGEGVVYVGIPPAGRGQGQIRLVIDGRQRMFNAVSRASSEISSQTRVRVVGVNADNTLTVEPQGSSQA